MKNTLLLFGLLFILFSCSTEPEFMSEGTIFSFDYRFCGCCGGWFIEIENDTLRFYKLPEKVIYI